MRWRRIVYWALWPFEQLCFFVEWCFRVGRALFIASNPALLAFWIVRREKRRREEDE